MKGRRVVAAALAVLLIASSASAIPIFDDPYTIYLLETVGNILRTVEDVELTIQLAIHHRVDVVLSHLAFPSGPGADGSIFEAIGQVIGQVRGIRREVQALSCSWVFSPRTALMRNLLLRPLKLCKPEFRFIWGTSQRHWDADAQELQDYVGTLTGNVISERVQDEEDWTALFPEMEGLSAWIRTSPGEANRDEAVLLAAAGQVANSNGLLASQKLLIDGLEREMERRDERLATTAGTGLLQDVACLDSASCDRSAVRP